MKKTSGITTIELIVPAYNMRRDFEIEHAKRLLLLHDNGGWVLPENSKYIFDGEFKLKTESN